MASRSNVVRFEDGWAVTPFNTRPGTHFARRRSKLSPEAAEVLRRLIRELYERPSFVADCGGAIDPHERCHEGAFGALCIYYSTALKAFILTDFELNLGKGGGLPCPLPAASPSLGGSRPSAPPRRFAAASPIERRRATNEDPPGLASMMRRMVLGLKALRQSVLPTADRVPVPATSYSDMLVLHAVLQGRVADVKVGFPRWSVLHCMPEIAGQLSEAYARHIVAGELICRMGAETRFGDPLSARDRRYWLTDSVGPDAVVEMILAAGRSAPERARAIPGLVAAYLREVDAGRDVDVARVGAIRTALSVGLTKHVWAEAFAARNGKAHACVETACEAVIRKYALVTKFMALSHASSRPELQAIDALRRPPLDAWPASCLDFERSVVIVIDGLGDKPQVAAEATLAARMSAIVRDIIA